VTKNGNGEERITRYFSRRGEQNKILRIGDQQWRSNFQKWQKTYVVAMDIDAML